MTGGGAYVHVAEVELAVKRVKLHLVLHIVLLVKRYFRHFTDDLFLLQKAIYFAWDFLVHIILRVYMVYL